MSDIYIKIRQGTGRLTGESLCRSCENAHIWTDAKGEHTLCEFVHPAVHIRGRTFECTDYYNKSLPTRHDLEAIAWVLRTERGGKAIGFAPPKKKKDDDD